MVLAKARILYVEHLRLRVLRLRLHTGQPSQDAVHCLIQSIHPTDRKRKLTPKGSRHALALSCEESPAIEYLDSDLQAELTSKFVEFARKHF